MSAICSSAVLAATRRVFACWGTRSRVRGAAPRCGACDPERETMWIILAIIIGDVSFAGYDPEKQKAYLLKALNVKPAPTDNGFDDEYAQAAPLLRAWFQERNTNSPSESNVKNAAYCAVIAAVLDRDYADRLSEFAIRQSNSMHGQWMQEITIFICRAEQPPEESPTVRSSRALHGSAFRRRIVLALCAVE